MNRTQKQQKKKGWNNIEQKDKTISSESLCDLKKSSNCWISGEQSCMNRKANPVSAYIFFSFILLLIIIFFSLEVEMGIGQRRVSIKPQKLKK